MKYSYLWLSILFIGVFSSCTEDDAQLTPKKKQSVSLVIRDLSDEGGRVKNSMSEVTQAVFTIQYQGGEETDYTLHEVALYHIGEVYTTEKISLQADSYQVVEFFLTDDANNILFATPVVGSTQAVNVNQPLPISFDVFEEESQSVSLEVISTKDLQPEDFGLVRFTVGEVPLLQPFVSVSEMGTDQLIATDVTVSDENGEYVVITPTSANTVNNLISLRAGLGKYRVQVDADGYEPYDSLFLEADLEVYQDRPLVVELVKNTIGFKVLDTDGSLYGISNAVELNGEVYYTKLFDGATISGYPDANVLYYRMSLFNEAGEVQVIETAPKGERSEHMDLTLTPNGEIALTYRVWAGFSYAFDGFYKVWDGSSLRSEQVFDNANYGLYPRTLYGTDGSPRTVSFSAAGYHFLYHTKNPNWALQNNLGYQGGWIGDYTAVNDGNDIFTACRIGSQVKLYSYVGGAWTNETITSGTNPRTHDIYFNENGELTVLYATDTDVSMATKSGTGWSVSQIVKTNQRTHNANALVTSSATYISYTNDDGLALLERENGSSVWEQIYSFTDMIYKTGRTKDSQITLLEVDGKVQLLFADHENVYRVRIN